MNFCFHVTLIVANFGSEVNYCRMTGDQKFKILLTKIRRLGSEAKTKTAIHKVTDLEEFVVWFGLVWFDLAWLSLV